MKKKKLIKLLNGLISSEENAAEELIQECDNPEAAGRCFNRAGAFRDILKYLENEGQE